MSKAGAAGCDPASDTRFLHAYLFQFILEIYGPLQSLIVLRFAGYDEREPCYT